MIDKFVRSVAEALAGIEDGSAVMVAGFGVGTPLALIEGLIEQGARDLTLVCNAGPREDSPTARLLNLGRVRKLVCSFVRPASDAGRLFTEGKLELEIMPQGTLAERIRAAGAGIEGFYTPTGAQTELAEGRELREIGGKLCMLEYPLRADVALLDAWEADRWGNLTFRDAQRNFNPIMAMAAALTRSRRRACRGAWRDRARAGRTCPGIFVDRVVHVPEPG